ncbi:MAG: transposase domain-containing protein, partial [Vicinamibacteraceae bacterium]
MPRTLAELPKGARITDYISLGVLAKTFPRARIDAVLARTKTASRRQRDLPAHVVVYYVIALTLYMQVSYREVLRCLLEGLQWLAGPTAALKITGKSGISQARTRLGWAPVKALADDLIGPIAVKETRGAWYRTWRLVTLDGTTFDVADTRENAAAFRRPGASRGTSAYPQLRLVTLVENGTHVLFGTTLGAYHEGETTL